MSCTRNEIVTLAQSWVGIKEGSNGHQEILDIYNSQAELPRGYKMTMKDAWCAATITALAVKLKATDIIPCECSCTKLIALAKEMGIWIEAESVTPMPGWFALYDWGDNGIGDCTGNPEHIGIVEKVENGNIIVIEGNYDGPDADSTDGVERRTLKVNGRYLRGFISPKYATEDAENEPAELPEKVAAGNMVFLRQLSKGSKGADVKALQILLIGNGCSCGIFGADGDFGSATEKAVKKYQTKMGLDADGICGPKTWSKLLGIN